MADNLDIRHQQQLVHPMAKLTKKQQREEKKIRKELAAKRAAEERAEKLRLDLEFRKKVKKGAVEKKTLEAERLEHVEAMRRRLEVEERRNREVEELKRRMEAIDLNDSVLKIQPPKKSVIDRLRDILTNCLMLKHVTDVIGKKDLERLSKLVSLSSDFDFKRSLFQEGYSVETKVTPARVLFDIGHGVGLEKMSEKNGEHKFFAGLVRFLFGLSHDIKYLIPFDQTGRSVGPCLNCSTCKAIMTIQPPSFEDVCINLKQFVIANRIAWRDLDLRGVIAEIEKESGRNERLKNALRRVRDRFMSRARVLRHEACFTRRITKMINYVKEPNQEWHPIINDEKLSAFDHLSARKKGLSAFPPSLVDCLCNICNGIDIMQNLLNHKLMKPID